MRYFLCTSHGARSSYGGAVSRLSVCAVLFVAFVVTGLTAPAASAAKPPGAADPAVIATWNQIAVSTITSAPPDGVGANAENFIWFAFVQAAVYNAVNGITREYELYEWHHYGPPAASPQAAAAVAAHRVLMEYFGDSPTVVANLDLALSTSLEPIPNGPQKKLGMRYGERAAARLIKLRADDGRFAPIVFDVPLVPGVWRPTPPGLAPFFDPWLGQVEPLVLDSLTQFRPGPPPSIDSALYVEEFEEVRDYGVSMGSLRSPDQTETARFFSDTAGGAMQAGLRDLAARRGLDISDSARLFAAVDLSVADAIGAVWDAKYHYGWWRPITAIREADGDGNPDTASVADWTPLLGTPPYPDWPSGLCGVIGAVSTALSRLNPDGRVDLTLTSAAAGVTRHYDDAALMQHDAIDARVWAGIHFRTADAVGVMIGTQVANWALDHHFAPTS
jgi:hypothetical protein